MKQVFYKCISCLYLLLSTPLEPKYVSLSLGIEFEGIRLLECSEQDVMLRECVVRYGNCQDRPVQFLSCDGSDISKILYQFFLLSLVCMLSHDNIFLNKIALLSV